MTTHATAPRADLLQPATASAPRASRPSRLSALIRAELLLLFRNKTTLFNAVALAPLIVAFFTRVGGDSLTAEGASGTASMLLVMLLALALVIVVYYNLTTTFVARREELVLKRLLTGDVSRGEIIVAYAAPAVLITLAQLVLGIIAMGIWFELPTVQNVLWLTIGIVGGTVTLLLLAVASSGLTRTVETAQLTTLPMLMIATALSGIAVPLHVMPNIVETIAQWTPVYPVVALVQHGLGAPTIDGVIPSGAWADVTQPLVALTLWIVISLLAAQRWMRWEPRR